MFFEGNSLLKLSQVENLKSILIIKTIYFREGSKDI